MGIEAKKKVPKASAAAVAAADKKAEIASNATSKASNAAILKFVQDYEKKGMIGNIGQKIDFISTQSWVIDRVIGDGTGSGQPGGIPRGFMTEVFGGESCGKTTLALHVTAEALRRGEVVVYADFENSLEAQWHYIKELGINYKDKTKFIHIRPDNYESGAKAIFEATCMFKPALVVVDSLAAAIPEKFLSGNLEEAVQVGLHARQTAIFCSTMNKVLLKCNTALLIINQLRSNIKGKYDEGPSEQTTGGKAQKYYMHLRLQMKPKVKETVSEISAITGMKEDKAVNQQVIVTAVKNKLDKPFRSAPVYIAFGKGIDSVRSLITLAEQRGVVKKGGGGYYAYSSPKNPSLNFSVQGKDALTKLLEERADIVEDMHPRLFPEIDTSAYVAARASGDVDSEDMDDEMRALMDQMSSNLTSVGGSLETPPEED